MPSAKQVVFDSDDDSDLGPLAGPLSSPPTGARRSPSPGLPEPANPPDISTSTDPSFFRDVYEEQQRALGLQLGGEIDPWEVPSSPVRPAGAASKQGAGGAKRKREAGAEAAANDISDDDLHGSSILPVTKRQRPVAAQNVDGHDGAGRDTAAEICIPLEALTPRRMNEYSRLPSSSIGQSFPSYTAGQAALVHPPSAAATESTIAYTTPSMYASSGRRALGSSNNAPSRSKSDHNMETVAEAVAVGNTTPPRRHRKAPEIIQLLSSPDIIAEPAPLREPQRRHGPPVEEDGDDGDVWRPRSTSSSRNKRTATQRQRQRRSSATDELCADLKDAPGDELVESDASDALFHSPPQKKKPAAQTVKKDPMPVPRHDKSIVIAASDDDGDDLDNDEEAILSPAADFSKVSSPKLKKAVPRSKKLMGKRETGTPLKNSAVISIELPAGPAEHSPGRSRERAKEQVKQQNQEAAQCFPNDSSAAKARLNTEKDGYALEDKPKVTKSRGKKTDEVKRKRDRHTPATSTALNETNGNAALSNSISDKSPENAKEDKAADSKVQVAAAEEQLPKPDASKPAAAGPPGGLSTGLATGSQGRVPYRVGLSRKLRIAPLLKMMRK